MIKCDKNKKKGHNRIATTMSPLWTFKIKSFCLFKTTHQNFYILFSKSILLLFFHICIYYTSFFNLFQHFYLFSKISNKKIFSLILFNKINISNNFSKNNLKKLLTNLNYWDVIVSSKARRRWKNERVKI